MKFHRALVYYRKGKVKCKRVKSLDPDSESILISLVYAGICGTDFEIVRGSRITSATILGHEGIGVVIEVGDDVKRFNIGQFVVFNPVNPEKQDDILGHSVDGLFQERFITNNKACGRGLIVRLSHNMPYLYGPLIEPLATVVYGHLLVKRLCKPRVIAIIGSGAIGLLNAIYARNEENVKVYLINRSKERLKWAIQRGIIDRDNVIVDSDKMPEELVYKNSGEVDAIYLCCNRASAPSAFRKAIRSVRDNGCVDFFVGIEDETSIPEISNLNINQIRRANVCGIPRCGQFSKFETSDAKRIWITGHRGTSAEHFNKAMRLLSKNGRLYSSVVSHVVDLESAALILERFAKGDRNWLDGGYVGKILIDYNAKVRSVKKHYI